MTRYIIYSCPYCGKPILHKGTHCEKCGKWLIVSSSNKELKQCPNKKQ